MWIKGYTRNNGIYVNGHNRNRKYPAFNKQKAKVIIMYAKSFAYEAHKNGYRKYTNEPYIVHPERVAALVTTVTNNPATIAASWLHDVVEDTSITIDQIYKNFGHEIGMLVSSVTNNDIGNRDFRNIAERDRISVSTPNAKTIKLADMIDNIPSLIKYDPKFAKVYLQEKSELLDCLVDGNHELFQIAKKLITSGFETLKQLKN
jgi:(p)ppGpp synthase/HD superfamily hydrolase